MQNHRTLLYVLQSLMHFSTAYYLMLLYLAVLFKPMIPVVIDAYGHAFHESFHLATVHEKYGSHHLDKALASTGSDNENSKSLKSLNTEDLMPVHIGSAQVACNFSFCSTDKQYHRFLPGDPSAMYLSKHTPPPEFS